MMHRFIPRVLLSGAVSLAFVLTGCTTIETRIAERQESFARMSPAERALVQEGKIREGMTQDAVYIAWGPPSQRVPGRNRGRIVETWIYDATAAGDYPGPFLYGSPYGYGLGYGYFGGFGRQRFQRGLYLYDPFFDPFFYSHSNIVRYPERTVSFQSGRVIGWQFLPPPRFF